MENIPYCGDNKAIASAIDVVLKKVPQSVRDFAFQHCVFTSIDEAKTAATYHTLYRPPPVLFIIVLSERILYQNSFRYRKCSENTLRYDVAYQLASVYLDCPDHLGIHIEEGDVPENAKRQELSTPDQLAEHWGFRPATGGHFYSFYLREKAAEEAERKWDEFTKLLPG